jgi:hypothetical protein
MRTLVSIEKYLEHFRETEGEDAWKTEVLRLAEQGIKQGPRHEIFWKELTKNYGWLDWEALKRSAKEKKDLEPPPTEPEQILTNLIRKQMPGIKTQGQYDAVVGVMDALRLVLNAILESSKIREGEASKALEMALEATRKATELTNKLEEVPEAATSKISESFKNAPLQFEEFSIHKKLLQELESIDSMESLNFWYAETKEERDRIVTQGLRNTLIDNIRSKKNQLLS